MKTILTTIFAIALMVFAFNTNSVMAKEKAEEDLSVLGDPIIEFGKWIECAVGDEMVESCNDKLNNGTFSENESGDVDNEKDVVDSSDEGSTSAASANDQ